MELFAIFVVNNNDFMKAKAKIEDKKPTKNKLGKAEKKSNTISSKTRIGSTKFIFFAEKLAKIDANEIPAKALIEKCLITTS